MLEGGLVEGDPSTLWDTLLSASGYPCNASSCPQLHSKLVPQSSPKGRYLTNMTKASGSSGRSPVFAA